MGFSTNDLIKAELWEGRLSYLFRCMVNWSSLYLLWIFEL